ncbi:major facilitator superfamily domain-containing protein [Hypoxylon cercidicola]|nr:major facilitator superfamily domain-containing protein [Hypoxylon cercidicola]
MSSTPSATDLEKPPMSEEVKPADLNEPVGEKDVGVMEEFIDTVAEKKLLRKIDIYLLTLFGCIYCMNSLDRSNIGNAALTSFEDDLGLVKNQYGLAVSIVYPTYIVFEPIWTVLFKIFSPKYTMTASIVGWAAISLGTGFIKNYSQLVAMRVLLGLFEAGIIPNITMYITMVYNRNEYAVRKSYTQIASALSGAFGGLLAYGLTQITNDSLKGWQWLYVVEGLLSFILVPATLLILPHTIATARWLNKKEQALIAARQARNTRAYDSQEKFTWSEVFRAAKDWRVWVQSVAHFGMNTALFAVTTFMPRIISGLGIASRVNSQLLTVPVYFVAGLSFYIFARLADRTKKPSLFLLISLSFLLLGFIILIAVPNVGGRFFGVFVLAVGLYSSTTMNVVWCATTHSGYFKRAIATSMVQVVGNVAGAVIGFIFTTQSAPRYMKGMWFAFAFTLVSIVCTLFLRFMLLRENAKKREAIAQGAPDQPELGDRNPHFLYYV